MAFNFAFLFEIQSNNKYRSDNCKMVWVPFFFWYVRVRWGVVSVSGWLGWSHVRQVGPKEWCQVCSYCARGGPLIICNDVIIIFFSILIYLKFIYCCRPDRYVPLFGEFFYDPSKWRPSVPFAEQLKAFKELIDEGKVMFQRNVWNVHSVESAIWNNFYTSNCQESLSRI